MTSPYPGLPLLSVMLYGFLLYKPWTFIKFVPECFILLSAAGTEIAFLISFQTIHSQGVEISLILYIDLVSLNLTKVAH